jgi:hypothetical protein
MKSPELRGALGKERLLGCGAIQLWHAALKSREFARELL